MADDVASDVVDLGGAPELAVRICVIGALVEEVAVEDERKDARLLRPRAGKVC